MFLNLIFKWPTKKYDKSLINGYEAFYYSPSLIKVFNCIIGPHPQPIDRDCLSLGSEGTL